ncbi:hypothetical protein TrRE_jg2912 [Triparma retinervis]|uniref:Uncharacterized protein n=1 Tax=Triparma retinervis TaxID=2557542 RepID=A0A9W7DW20_9STRA|nr:hypothetical protein TrRE_jg2912 [Triparma retinervis]
MAEYDKALFRICQFLSSALLPSIPPPYPVSSGLNPSNPPPSHYTSTNACFEVLALIPGMEWGMARLNWSRYWRWHGVGFVESLVKPPPNLERNLMTFVVPGVARCCCGVLPLSVGFCGYLRSALMILAALQVLVIRSLHVKYVIGGVNGGGWVGPTIEVEKRYSSGYGFVPTVASSALRSASSSAGVQYPSETAPTTCLGAAVSAWDGSNAFWPDSGDVLLIKIVGDDEGVDGGKDKGMNFMQALNFTGVNGTEVDAGEKLVR